jgi:outer membrane receptor protein involved in Fe transport
MIRFTLRPLPAAFALIAASAWADNPAARLEAPTVQVVGTTPLPGIGVPLERVPANVQGQNAEDFKRQQPLDLSEQLVQNLSGVVSNPAQNNPWQPDISFRGFTASPLMGSPQGLSVFLDGVRVNEAFGDTVNWDLIPPNAIASTSLVPGSNPVFGLNTLGGTLAVQTKSGLKNPGGEVQITGGSWGRSGLQFETGHHAEGKDFFAAGNFAHEDGWRQHSASDVKQFFAKTGYEDDRNDLDISLLLADNNLNGVQALPLSMLNNRRQAYTWPDRTDNRLAMVNARGSHFITDDRLLAAGAYVRRLTTNSLSSNVNDNFDPSLPGGPLDPTNPQGTMDRSHTTSLSWGASLQYTDTSPLGRLTNQWTVGTSLDAGRTDYRQWTSPGDFTADRTVTVTGPEEEETAARTTNRYLGLYFTDTLSLSEQWHATLSARWNDARVQIHDASGINPALEGDHHFQRLNPALGVNYTPRQDLTAYAAYSEGMRVATPMELTCADPTTPCKLPNNFLADPALKPVISHTWETGLRGKLGADSNYSAAVFRTDLDDDIQFISSGGNVNAGYFQNIGKTRRQGLELAATTRTGAFTWSAAYSYLQATFESPLTIHSPANSSADLVTGDIEVKRGDRLTAVPTHSLRLRGEYQGERLALGASLIAVGRQYARGDENNQDINGRLPAYAVVNLDGSWKLDKGWEIIGRVNNLFDRRYDAFAVLGTNFFRSGGFDATTAAAEQFRSPGAPRGVWIGLRYAWPGS